MELGFTTAAYVVAAVLFILSLGGLSGQESAKRAVWYGIVGMGLAVLATLIGPGAGLWWLSAVLIAAGGLIGYQLASKVEMTQMPELVAGMHALVGLAAVFVGFNAHFELVNVMAMDDAAKKTLDGFAALLAKKSGVEINILRVEASLGIWIGAVTFTGSVIAYGKLAGKVTSAATKLPGGHALNASAALGLGDLFDLVSKFRRVAAAFDPNADGAVYRLSFDHGDWRRGYARGGVDAEFLFGLGGCSDRV